MALGRTIELSMRTIRTTRLRLIPVTVQNATSLWRLLQQPDLRTYQDLPNLGAGAFTEMVGKRPKNLTPNASGRFEWLMYVLRARRAIGWVSLRIGEQDIASGEIGYSVVKDFRGQGMATEAVRAVVHEAFHIARLARVHAYCVPENEASRRVLERVGFSCEGTLPHGATVSGEPVDVLIHHIERDSWIQSGNSIVTPASAYPA
jgi:[ribosomal protein S5]-alanine N-acetyltransferase